MKMIFLCDFLCNEKFNEYTSLPTFFAHIFKNKKQTSVTEKYTKNTKKTISFVSRQKAGEKTQENATSPNFKHERNTFCKNALIPNVSCKKLSPGDFWAWLHWRAQAWDKHLRGDSGGHLCTPTGQQS